MALRLSALCSPEIFLSVSGTHFSYRLSNLQGLVRLQGLGKLIKFDDLIRSETRNLPACSIVPQPTMLLHAPAEETEKCVERRSYGRIPRKLQVGLSQKACRKS
jgi:hypothetical protein